MKRWPRVTSLATIPSTSNGTTAPSNRNSTALSGRTQRKADAPERIDLGQGKARITSPTAWAAISGVGRPGAWRVA